jgi:flagellar biosynthetic protein FliR
MDLRLLQPDTIITFMLVVIRISGLTITAPLLANKGIPAYTKVGFIITLSLLLFPLNPAATGAAPQDLPQLAWVGSQEFLVGLGLGFAASLMFAGVQLAGEYISVQMGLAVANVLDPINSAPIPVLGQFYYTLAIVLFLSMNVHHTLILALQKSFQWIPLGKPFPQSGLLIDRFMTMGSEMFLLALLLALPVLGLLFVSEMAMAFVAKVMPQMNVFMVGLPLKAGLALMAIMISLPFSERFLSDQYAILVQQLMGLYRLPAGTH